MKRKFIFIILSWKIITFEVQLKIMKIICIFTYL